MSNKSTRLPRWLLWYAWPTLIGIGVLCLLMTMYSNTLIPAGDGYIMTYPALVYTKEFWRNLFTGKLIMMDFTMGEGLDPIISLMYYGLSDPMSIIFTIVPDSALVSIFNIVSILKIVLSGLAFGWFASKHSKDDKAIALGALVYTFSSFMLFWLYHPGLLSGGYLLPLLLIAFDRALDKKKYTALAFVTLFAYLTNYYIAAVLSFMLLTYAIIRLCMNNTWNKSAIWHYCKTASAHALGILSAMIVLLPMVMALMGGARDNPPSGYSHSLLFFNPGYYIDTLIGLFTSFNNFTRYWVAPYKMQSGFLCIAAPALVLFLSTKTEPGSKARRLKWALFACTLFICVPLFSKLFNLGMYPTHRWAVAFALVISMITVWAVPKFAEMKTWQKLVAAGAILFSAIGSLFVMYPLGAIAMIACAVLVLPIMLIKPRRLTAYIAATLSIVMMIFSAFVGNQQGSYFVDNKIEQFATNSIYSAVELTDEELEDMIRVGITDNDNAVNIGMLINYNTTTAIWNVMPAGICDWNYHVNEFPETDVDFWVNGWDDRTAPLSLAGTKYFVTDEQGQSCVPYGFTLLKEVKLKPTLGDPPTMKEHVYYVYQNQYNPGLGYLMTQTMSYDYFMTLDTASKQLAMMQYAIIDTEQETQFESGVISIPFSITGKNGKQQLTCTVPEGYELYLCADNVKQTIWVNKVTPHSLEHWATTNQSTSVNSNADTTHATNAAYVTATDQNGLKVAKKLAANREYAHLQSGNPKRAMCLGSQLTGKITIDILYNKDAITVEGLHLWAIPVDAYKQAADALSMNKFNITEHGNNTITGNIDATKNGIMQLAVPYQNGWKAYVDGKEVPVMQCGVKYMGVQLDAGFHEVRFEYITPGLIPGALISAASIMLMFAWLYIEYRKNKKH